MPTRKARLFLGWVWGRMLGNQKLAEPPHSQKDRFSSGTSLIHTPLPPISSGQLISPDTAGEIEG